jgi:hypothetical protein
MNTIFALGSGALLYAEQHLQSGEKSALKEAFVAGKKVSLHSACTASFFQRPDTAHFISETLPYTTELCILAELRIEAIQAALREQRVENCKVLLVETFPYGTEQLRDLLQQLKWEYPYLSVHVLQMPVERNVAFTDMDDPETARAQAVAMYEKVREGCVVSEQTALLLSRFSISSKCLLSFERKMYALKDVLANFEKEFADNNDFFFSIDTCKQAEVLDSFCKWSKIKRSAPVIDSYIANFTQYLCKPDGDFYKAVVDFYTEIMEPLCIWNIHDDIKDIFERMTKRFSENVRKKVDDKGAKYSDELTYRKESDKLQVDFKQFITNNFFERGFPAIIKKKIEDRYQTLEKICGDK